jgi:Uma2 family endonuclease
MRESEVQIRPLKRVEYELLVEKGFFEPGERVELIDGLLMVSEPQSAYHFTGIQLVEQALARALGDGWVVRGQGPIALDDTSEPEPDVAVIRGRPRDYAHAHPAEPILVVEVALTSLAFDRTVKSSLYARAGRPEYWIVNLVGRALEVRRNPALSPSAPYGWDYTAVEVLSAWGSVSPLAAPAAMIAVADLLP